jgi:hypothetical protein
VRFGGLGSYTIDMVLTKGTATSLSMSREFTFGADGQLYFGAEAYPDLKHIFDEVHARDTHSISIKAN